MMMPNLKNIISNLEETYADIHKSTYEPYSKDIITDALKKDWLKAKEKKKLSLKKKLSMEQK